LGNHKGLPLPNSKVGAIPCGCPIINDLKIIVLFHRIQNGFDPENWKPLQNIGAGIREIRISEDGNIFRVIYVTKFADKIYVLHSFQKKTQKTSPKDINIIKIRYNSIIGDKLP